MNKVKRNQNAISGLILHINQNIKKMDNLLNLLKTYNRQCFKKSELFSEKNKLFAKLCKMQDILALERKLEAHYIREQNKIEFGDKFQITHSIITNFVIRKERKIKERENNKLFIRAVSECGSSTSFMSQFN